VNGLRVAALLWVALPLGASEPVPAPAPTRITLPDAINRALERNRDLARTRVTVRASEFGLLVARAGFAYRYAPVGGASTTADGDRLETGLRVTRRNRLGQEVQARAQAEQDSQEEDTLRRARASLQFTQPLFRNFGRLVNEEPLERAHADLRRARRGLEIEADALIVRVAETYLELIRLERRILSDEAFLKRAGQLLDITRLRERQGRATRVDSLRVSLQRGEAAARLEQSSQRLHLARLDFLDLLGAEPDLAFTLEPPPVETDDLPDSEHALRLAFANRLDYAQALDDARDRDRALRIARKNLQPDLALVARYERFGEGTAFSDATRFDEDNWAVALAANRDLNPSLESANLGRAELDRRAAGDDATLRAIAIRRTVQQQLVALRSARQELEIAEQNRALAASRATLAQRLFRLGRGDNFSVTDAEEAFLQAENAWQDAQAAWIVSTFRLRQELGTLSDAPDELKPAAFAALDTAAP
jgi:outer membrane protein TolC